MDLENFENDIFLANFQQKPQQNDTFYKNRF